MYSYEMRLRQAQAALEDADAIVIGGGAGLSAAAGLTFSGPRFTENFADFIERYGFTDLYTSSFHPFKTEEERWAYWARHIHINRYAAGPTPLYQNLLALMAGKEYTVITTNVDNQFIASGFAAEKVWMVQGDYGFLQCAKACHKKLYYNRAQVEKMMAATINCKIPTELVPRCPVCGGQMSVHVHSDNHFIQGEKWQAGEMRYTKFLQGVRGKRVVYLELGVGFNTAGIIRYPFEQLTYQNPKAILVRLNRDHPEGPKENTQCTVPFTEDMGTALEALLSQDGVKRGAV